jgi:N-acetylglucosamine kinase-like BadF-type ATPase
MAHRLALGVDGGGTKSDAVLIDETGNVLAFGRGGSVHSLYIGSHAAYENYAESIREALKGRELQTLWVAGASPRVFEHAGIEIPEARFIHAHEHTMALAMALETHGIVVLAGTGSFVSATGPDGERLTLDGLGPVLGDCGSGYQIGLAGMRAAMASSWATERKTALEALVPQELEVTTLHDIFDLVYTQHIGRSRIASVAKAVLRAAEDGDAVARNIILQAADDISDVLENLIRRLSLEKCDWPMVASGGIAQNCEMYWARVCERAKKIAPHLRPTCPKVRPCVGAALLALREMGVPWSEGLLAKIEGFRL